MWRQSSRRSSIRKLGPACFFLSMEIIRDRSARTIALTQRKYAEEILQRTGMAECKGKSTPMETNLKLSKDGDDPMEDPGRYAEAVGMLLYLTTCTRPDMAFAVGVLARFISKPREEHWARVKGVLHYLKETADYGIIYGAADSRLEGYADSDFAADPDRLRSTGGYVFTLAGGRYQLGLEAAADCGDVYDGGGVHGERQRRKGGAVAAQADDDAVRCG